MTKVISYSIFRAPCEKFEFMAYLRGIYFNVRMNKLIYPEWQTVVNIEQSVFDQYTSFFEFLSIGIVVHQQEPLCKSMLWRMFPIYMPHIDVTHILCRDADALTSYREAQAVKFWLLSGKDAHVIHDNPAHGGLMGGLVGFKTQAIKKAFSSFDVLTDNWDLSKRGSDQNLLNKRILPLIKDSLYTSEGMKRTDETNGALLPEVDKRLWESNLCSAFIGSAGVNELETLRFFKRFDKTDYSEFEKEHSDICYWAR